MDGGNFQIMKHIFVENLSLDHIESILGHELTFVVEKSMIICI